MREHATIKMHRLLLATAVFLFSSVVGSAQVSVQDSAIGTPMFDIAFGVQLPGGEFAKRFNSSYTLGGGLTYKMRSNFILGGEGHFIWSDRINQDGLLTGLLTERGEVINQNGEYAFIRTGLRGFYMGLNFGKQWPVIGPNPNSGLFVTGGLGFTEYRIRFDVEDKLAPQLREDYEKLYDQRTNGLTLTESIGYRHLGQSRMVNFFIALDVRQGFTRNRRDYNLDLGGGQPDAQFDMWYGARIGWSLPIYQRAGDEFYYY